MTLVFTMKRLHFLNQSSSFHVFFTKTKSVKWNIVCYHDVGYVRSFVVLFVSDVFLVAADRNSAVIQNSTTSEPASPADEAGISWGSYSRTEQRN